MSDAEARDFKCKRSTILTSSWAKRVSGRGEPRHLPARCNEFLICPPEKSKWKIGNLSRCLPGFITAACAGLHLGILLFFSLSLRRRSLLWAVWVSLSPLSFQRPRGRLFVLLAPVHQQMQRPAPVLLLHGLLGLVLPHHCAYNAQSVPSGAALRLQGSQWLIIESSSITRWNKSQNNNETQYKWRPFTHRVTVQRCTGTGWVSKGE